ncbi:MAG: hypothetical protein AAF385_06265 [Pseudomonadota bacterium]
MRPYETSDATRESLRELSQSPDGTVMRRFRRGRALDTELIDRIKKADELASVIGLSQFLSGPKNSVAPIVDAITAILDHRDPVQLARLDEQCRQYSEYSYAVWNWAQQPKNVLKGLGHPAILGLFSMHPSGYVRETAVKRLKRFDTGQALTFLLIRSNDWVKQVRKLAIVEVIDRATSENVEQFVDNLALIDRCSSKTRGDFSMARAAIDILLTEHPDLLERHLSKSDFRLRRAIYDISRKFENSARQRFIRLGLQDNDPLARLRAARSVAEIEDIAEKQELVDELANDPFYAIRLTGLRLTLADSTERKEAILRKLIVDRSRSVRQSARFHLKHAGLLPTDTFFAEQYREAITSGDLVAGLYGLGECGGVTDLEMIEDYLGRERPAIASAALDSICKLSEDDQIDLLLKFLKHDYPRCSRTAAHWLSNNQSPLVHEACLENIDNTALPLHVRRNSLSVSLRQNKWSSLEAILAAIGDGHSDLAEFGQAALSRWVHHFNRSFVQPTEQQRQRIGEALNLANLDQHQQRQLFAMLN